MKGVGCFLVPLFVGVGSVNAKAFVGKTTTTARFTKEEPQSCSKKLLSTESKHCNVESSLMVRGGALFPNEPAAKIATGAAILSGISAILNPEANVKTFKLPNGPYEMFKLRYIGYASLAHPLMASLLLVNNPKISVATATTVGMSILAVPFIMNKDFYQLLAVAIVGGIGSMSFLAKTPSVEFLLKALGLTGFTMSFLLAYVSSMDKFFCSSLTKQRIRGNNNNSKEGVVDQRSVDLFNRFLGHTYMGFFLFVHLVTEGMNVPRAVGLSVIPPLVNNIIQNFISGDVEHYGMPFGAQMITTAFTAIIVVACSI